MIVAKKYIKKVFERVVRTTPTWIKYKLYFWLPTAD